MKHLKALNKYFWKYRKRFFLGVIFIICSNYFRILSPQVSGYIINKVTFLLQTENGMATTAIETKNYDVLVRLLIHWVETHEWPFATIVLLSGFTLLVLALLGGFFMFLMRQTIIVMSRHIEFDQKNEVFKKYQQLDIGFYKKNSTGDLMNRMAEDVSRVRMYTGPAIMYLINLTSTIVFCVWFMLKENWQLTLFVLAPLPILAVTIYFVNTSIHKKSTEIQEQLSNLTTTAQESYSGIRVIKSYVQEKAMLNFFTNSSNIYKQKAIGLAKLDAVYFPSMALLIGVSTIITIAVGGWYHASGKFPIVTAGTITEFVIYVNLLTFPVSAIGWTASMIQRAAASQQRLNEFLHIQPAIVNSNTQKPASLQGAISFKNVHFTYANTGIQALKNFNLHIEPSNKILVLGKTGSGKTTIAQLLLKFYAPQQGSISINAVDVNNISMHYVRDKIAYVPQDVFLFSDTVANNIAFGLAEKPTEAIIEQAAKNAGVHNEIIQFEKGYQTVVGERGVTLSGGQKQRIAIARGLIKTPDIIVLDDCLSAVDANTEKQITQHLSTYLAEKTAIVISHRIFTSIVFDSIVVVDNGAVAEQGTHEQLMAINGLYATLYNLQLQENAST
jgi:ATP-binding cassette, subfamily B, multidrug efflux pump